LSPRRGEGDEKGGEGEKKGIPQLIHLGAKEKNKKGEERAQTGEEKERKSRR